MKPPIYAISFLLFWGIGSSGYAQIKANFGLTSGYNSTFVLDKGLEADPRYISQTTYNFSPIGIVLGAEINPRYALQFESILSNQGQLYHIVDVAKRKIGERKIDLQYIHLPLLLKRLTGRGTGRGFNFMLGPQLSLLQQGLETYQHTGGIVELPKGETPPPGASLNPDGTYTVPAVPETTILSSSANDMLRQFREMDVQIAFGLGYEFRVAPALFISTNLRGNYGLLDMRNEELIDNLKNNTTSLQDLFGHRANLLLGLQVGLNYQIGRGLGSRKPKEMRFPGTFGL